MSDISDEYEKAMAVLNDLAKDYLVWVQEDLQKLKDAYQRALSLDGENRTDVIRNELFRTAHDMKGQGATFGYDLVTYVGNHLCRYIERFDCFNEEEMTAIDTHINALQQIIENQLIGAGGPEGENLKKMVESL